MNVDESILVVDTEAGALTLRSVEISLTYGGLIEGVPDHEYNNDHLRWQLERVQSRWRQYPVHLIPPVRTDPGGSARRPGEAPLELLPPLECVGLLHGRATRRAVGDWMFTGLVVLWYQERGDSVIHPVMMERLRHLPWDEVARDFTFDDM